MASIQGIRQFLQAVPSSRAQLALCELADRLLPSDTETDVGLTAHSGGTQAAALLLNARTSWHEVTIVGAAGDSVLLPTPKVGEIHFVRNSGANSMQVFADGLGTITGVATATGVAQPAGQSALYWCQTYGNYLSLTGFSTGGDLSISGITGSDSSLGITGQAAAQGGAVTVTGGVSGTSGNAGGAVNNVGGVGGATGAGGAVVLTGGVGGVTSGTGGAITITSGAAGATTGVSGAISIAVGASTAGNGSAITITGGNGAGGTASGGSVNIVPGTAVSTGVPGEFQISGDSGLIPVVVALTATDASRHVYICTRPMRLKAVKSVFTTASSSGTLQVEKLTGTTAAGSGTALLTGTVALSGSANTVASGTLIGTVASLTFAAGDRVGVVIAGTMTNLVGSNVTIMLAPA